MKRLIMMIAAIALVTLVSCQQQPTAPGASAPAASSQATEDVTHMVRLPGNILWKPLFPGSELAVVSGDPDKTGAPFVIRIKNQDGLKVPPHWHPGDEHITVIAGTFVVGMGSTFDPSVGQELTVGAYMLVPKQMPHFAWAKGEVIIQVHGIGPFQIIWVNPADDPAKKPRSR